MGGAEGADIRGGDGKDPPGVGGAVGLRSLPSPWASLAAVSSR